MKILAYKDLILAYIRKDYADDEQKSLVEKFFYNENSIFLYSQKFIKLLESEIDKSERSREIVRFEAFVKKIQNEHQDKRPFVETSKTSKTIEDEFIEIFLATQDNIVVSISCNQPSQEIQTQIPNIAVLSQQQKPNYHWLVVNLAILHPNTVQLRNYDFKTDKEVDELFYNIFSIPKNIRSVSIFDDACNLQHKKFDFLIEKRISVLYYTVKLNILDSKQRFDDLRKKLSVKMFGKPKGGHEREINFEGIIIIPTNDFWMLNVTDDKKWSISISYNEEEAKKSLSYKDKYVRFLDNKWGNF